MSAGEHVDVQPEYLALARSLAVILLEQYALSEIDRPVIAIAGESGSGKSVTATCLARELDASGIPTVVLHQDDYFHRPPRANHEHRVRDLSSVGPQEVNLDLLRSHAEPFRVRARGVTGPAVDYSSDTFVTRQLDFATAKALIVEGTYVLRLDHADVRIFLDATHDDTRERRRMRNRDIDAPVIDRILAAEHEIIAAQAPLAQITIARDFTIRR